MKQHFNLRLKIKPKNPKHDNTYIQRHVLPEDEGALKTVQVPLPFFTRFSHPQTSDYDY